MRLRNRKWQYEICKKCHRKQRLAWAVNNFIWDKVVPKKFRNRVLCFECFLEFASQKKITITQNDLLCLGWIDV